MIKELWILVKMLFASNPNDFESMEVIDMNHFPFEGFKAMSWCGCIVHRIGSSEIDKRTISHEDIHLAQAKLCGSWWKYYLKYLWEWLKGNPIIHPASSAYMTIPFECEAYGNEDNPDYAKNYDGSNIGKYTFKKRKKLYKDVGWSAAAWKRYVKSL